MYPMRIVAYMYTYTRVHIYNTLHYIHSDSGYIKLMPHCNLSTEKDKLILAIDRAERGDTGTFHLKLSNDAGSAECPITVTVIGE